MIEFIVPGRVQGKARARTFYNPKMGKMMSVTPEQTVNYENLIKICFMQVNPKHKVIEGAVKVEIKAYFSKPKSYTKKQLNQIEEGDFRPLKIDCDNIAKIILDGLNKIAYHDDRQVCELKVTKDFADKDYVLVKIEEVVICEKKT